MVWHLSGAIASCVRRVVTPAEARLGGRRGRRVLLGGGLVFGLLDPGKVGVQFGYRFTTGACWARITFEAVHFPALLFTNSMINPSPKCKF